MLAAKSLSPEAGRKASPGCGVGTLAIVDRVLSNCIKACSSSTGNPDSLRILTMACALTFPLLFTTPFGSPGETSFKSPLNPSEDAGLMPPRLWMTFRGSGPPTGACGAAGGVALGLDATQAALRASRTSFSALETASSRSSGIVDSIFPTNDSGASTAGDNPAISSGVKTVLALPGRGLAMVILSPAI